jgi:hypothetical protein
LHLRQSHAAAPVEAKSFLLEEHALRELVARAGAAAYLPSSVDDAMPRHCGTGEQRVERVTHLPRATWQAGN